MQDPKKPKKNKAAVELGKLGGAAGRGESKRRGDTKYYAALSAKALAARGLTPKAITK